MHEAERGYRPLGAVHLEGRPEVVDTSGGRASLGAQSLVAPTWHLMAEDGAHVAITLLAADLARVRLLPPGVAPASSWAVARADEEWPAVDVRIEERAQALTLTTAAMSLVVAMDPFRLRCAWPDGTPFAEDDPRRGMGYIAPRHHADIPEGSMPPGSPRCFKRLAPGERIFGCAEHTGPLDRRGTRMIFFNIDPPRGHSEKTGPMYTSIPFWLGLWQGRAYGIFQDSPWRSEVDAGATIPDILSFGPAGGDLTYYVFAGPAPAAVLARYADLTGHMPLPPRWALGFGQSRWSYYPEEYLREVAAGFRKHRIPCDMLWLDIDYMDGFRVFTWNPRRYSEPERLLHELGAEGFKVITIIDPGVKTDPTDPTFAEGVARDYFVRLPDGSLSTGLVWPGKSAFPDFSRAEVRAWWGERHRALLDAGVAGIWDDMNEPALMDFFVPGAEDIRDATMPEQARHWPNGKDQPPLPHAAFHNAFGMQMARATFEGQERLCPERRPFVLTRSGYAGVQRYAAIWTGDNTSTWEHLRLAVRMCLGLGLSGVPFVGFDTGGFWESADGDLLARFTQLGAVFPLFRNHSARDTVAQEPWAFGQPYTAICRSAIELRYRLLPYLYTLFAQAAREGSPITRALAYAYPDDDALAGLEDEFLLGGDLLAAPVLDQGQMRHRVLFPHGAWRDWLTGERYVGGESAIVEAPLDVLPLFAREGAIIPLGPVMQYVGERPEEPLTLACWLGPEADARAEGELYEDDGATPEYQRGAWRRTRIVAERTPSGVTIRAETLGGDYTSAPREWVAELHLPLMSDTAPTVTDATVERRRYETVMRVALGRRVAPFTAEIALG